MTFADPDKLARWRKRKAEVARYVENGTMTEAQAKQSLELYIGVLMTEAKRDAQPEKPRHLRIVG